MDALTFRVPTDLRSTETTLRNVLVIGACFLDVWQGVIQPLQPDCNFERILFNHLTVLPDRPARPFEEYDFQIVAIPFRSVLPEATYLRLSYADAEAHERLFNEAVQRLDAMLDSALRYNREHHLATFVVNFFLPVQSPLGRMLPRYDLRNPVHFVERLNRVLYERVQANRGAHVVDVDEIAATFGRRYIQDDPVAVLSHNSLIHDYAFGLDLQRLEPPTQTIAETYQSKVEEFVAAAWAEVVASYRTLAQVDMVKMVVVDLDDTLWRGVMVDRDGFDPAQVEGWPLGVAEALAFLKKRGVLLAIVSKNEEQLIRNVWSLPFGGRLELEDFAFVRINWQPKAANIDEIVRAANILPTSVVFVDDNPVERAAVAAALPGIRVMGSNPFLTRRILLWSPETQVAQVSAESARRTELMHGQQEREAARTALSRDAFLASLDVRVQLTRLRTLEDPRLARALELINKTNQFNTTGRRWSADELDRAFEAIALYSFSVTDRFSQYGLVGVLIVRDGVIEQFVMSCRVLGMDVEVAVVDAVARRIERERPSAPVGAVLVETAANYACRDVYAKAGFVAEGNGWLRPSPNRFSPPAHVAMTVEE